MMPRAVIILSLLLSPVMPAAAGPTEDALRVGQEAFDKKEYGSALTTWVNAYNERATADTATDETCATLLTRAAALLAQTGRYKESATCLMNLLKLREKLNGPEDLATQKVKSLLGAQISNAGGDVDRAEILVRESAEALAKAGDEHIEDRLLALTNLAGILYVKKDRLGAHELYAEVVSLSEKNPGKAPNLAIEAYRSMSSIADFFGRSKDSLQYLRKSAELSRKHYGNDSPTAIMSRIEVATALTGAGMNADAKSAYDGIIADLEKKAPSPDEKLLQQRWATAAFRLAAVERTLGNSDRAFELIKSSLSHAVLGWGDLDANTLPLYLELAKQNIVRKNYKEGVRCYQKVLDIRRRELGPDDKSTRETQQILNELLEDVRKAEAGRK